MLCCFVVLFETQIFWSPYRKELLDTPESSTIEKRQNMRKKKEWKEEKKKIRKLWRYPIEEYDAFCVFCHGTFKSEGRQKEANSVGSLGTMVWLRFVVP